MPDDLKEENKLLRTELAHWRHKVDLIWTWMRGDECGGDYQAEQEARELLDRPGISSMQPTRRLGDSEPAVELLPCICGSRTLHISTEGNLTWVACTECRAVGPRAQGEREAVDSWNIKRTPQIPEEGEPV
ncbi:hypothetical protein LCGC14_0231340 [marine sediment metagenome]|uniref:Uncharacterized protein n=1 Tax=marine sediment metagenome TaxID=412755 RepID=A0A0F9UR94_9ZZZZ